MTVNADSRAERLRRAIRLKKEAAGGAANLPARPPTEPAHLGALQRSLWLAHQLNPGSPAYNLASGFHVEGTLDMARLERAFEEVVSRHRILRSTFRAVGDTALQVVHPALPAETQATTGSVTEADTEHVTKNATKNATENVTENVTAEQGGTLAAAVREASRPFDLTEGPLIRLRLIEEGGGKGGILLLVLHHLLADERSLARLWQELAAAYATPGTPLPRSAQPPSHYDAPYDPHYDAHYDAQYDDYVHWLRGREEEERSAARTFWRDRLDPWPEVLHLPFEELRDGEAKGAGRLITRPLPQTTGQGIRRLAAAVGLTPFMVFAFAFRLLLHRYTQGQHIAFATPVSRRTHPATAEMIGYFLNPVVVVAGVDEEQSVAAALEAFGRELKELLAHGALPFQVMTEEFDGAREPDRHPIFQSMFVYQVPPPPPVFGDARLTPVTLDLGASKFDLTLFVTEGEQGLDIAVEYRTDRVAQVWMERLLGHYTTLLEHLPGNLERAAGDVPLLTVAEQAALESCGTGGALQSAGPLLPQQILERARSAPEAPAVTCDGTILGYGELVDTARRIARELAARGVKAGDRVGVFVERSPEMIAAILGSHFAGAGYVPLDPAYPSARNRDILEDAEVAAVLTTSTVADQRSSGSWFILEVDRLGDRGEDAVDVDVELSPEAPAYILYTSGSTGRPKGVVVSHGNLRSSNGARFEVYDTRPQRFLLVSSISFDSSVAGLFWTLAAGGTLVIPTDDEARDPQRLARRIATEGVTSMLLVPSLHAQLLSLEGDLLRSLDTVIVAGEACPSQLVEEHFRMLPAARLFNEYGPTEATVWVTVYEMTPEDAHRPVAIGRPIPGVRVEVVDDRSRPVPAGIPGQAWVVGRTVAQGYWRRPDLTAERFAAATPGSAEGSADGSADGSTDASERRYRTGDQMAWTPEGQLLFLGREDEQIKLRGFRIEPGEIEAALLASPDIEQVAVLARPRGAAASEAFELVAFLQTSQQTTEGRSAAERRRELATRLPPHMIPSRWVVLPQMPRLPNGKVDRRRLRDLKLPDAERNTASRNVEEERVLSTRELALTSLWEGLLGKTGIGPHDNLFELGAHSLLVAQATLAIERDFEVSLRATDVFEHPTVHQLAQRLEGQSDQAAPYRHLFPIQTTGRGRPFIVAVPHFFTPAFAARFRGERPVYGLRGVSLRAEGNRGRWPTMGDLGEELVDEIRRRFPDEAFLVAGYSFGASMAMDVVRVMETRKIPVQALYLIAPMPFDFYRFGPFSVQLDGLREPVDALPPTKALRLFLRGMDPRTRQPYQRARQWLTVQPWRRLLCFIGALRKRAALPLTPRILHADVRLERFRLHRHYRPEPIQTPTLLFNAKEPATDAAATWRPFFRGPFTVQETPDPHLGEASVKAAQEVILHRLRDLGRD